MIKKEKGALAGAPFFYVISTVTSSANHGSLLKEPAL